MHYINSIVSIEPNFITVMFDGKEARRINFTSIITDFPALNDAAVFNSVTLDDYPTLKWDDLARIKELDGSIVPGPLDFSPDVLYSLSERIS